MGGRSRILPYVTTVVLLSELLYSVASDNDGDAGNSLTTGQCASGFPSLDRIDAVLNYGDVTEFGGNVQAIIPSTNFTCDGSIHSWVFGGRWRGSTDSLTELQIWRPGDEDGVYDKVGSTTINVMEGELNQRRLYHYNLSSPLPFQTEDILGFYRSGRHVNLIFENVGSGHLLHYSGINHALSQYDIQRKTGSSDEYHVLIGITTDSPECANGFMSVERMRLLLELDSVSDRIITIDQRQQITPDMRFTCDGMITKWIIGANWGSGNDDTLYPELQIWRNIGNDTYQKISGTFIEASMENANRIYEYDDFSPIPVQTGDILGAFIPQTRKSKLRLIAENGRGPTNYYIPTTVSPRDIIDTQLVTSTTYRPLVTVEIVVTSSTKSSVATEADMVSSTMQAMPTGISVAQPSNPTESSVVNSGLSPGGTLVSPTPTADKSSSESSDSGSQSALTAGVGGATAVLALALVVCVFGVLLIVWRRRKTSKEAVLANGHVDNHLNNPVYDGGAGNGNAIHSNKPTLQQDGRVYESPSGADYELVGSRPSQDTKTFDNPLYSDAGPVTTTESAVYESAGSALSGAGGYCVPTIEQRRKMTMDQSNQDHVYSVVGAREFFQEKDIYWPPASTVTGIYEQLSVHKYREINRQHVEVGGSLGSGQFGVVSRGKWQTAVDGSVEVAIKTLRPSAKETDKVKFLQEAAINGQFRHPNIVQLHGVVTVGEPVMIVLEYLPNGDLRNFLHSLINQADPPQQSELSHLCLSFSQQVASGMSYLAGKAFVHRDLAARNILVSENTVCKVADFGMARDLHEDSYYVSRGGQIPVKWTAPEALHYKKYSTASDVWSFGCLMYEIWSLGHKPFEGYTNSEVLDLVTKGNRLAPPPGCPRHIYSTMMNCWNSEKSSRPSFQSLCQSLAGEPATLLQWREEDSQCHPQASLLGAELEAGKHLYTELQQTYLQRN